MWLAEELATHRASARNTPPAGFVFATRNGTRRQRSNVTRQILGPAVAAANQRLRREGRPEVEGVTNHSLRRTFASLLYEAGASPAYVMAQMGHASSALALEVYARKMERQRDTGARMGARSSGPPIGHQWAPAPIPSPRLETAGMRKPCLSRVFLGCGARIRT
jgi:integrase